MRKNIWVMGLAVVLLGSSTRSLAATPLCLWNLEGTTSQQRTKVQCQQDAALTPQRQFVETFNPASAPQGSCACGTLKKIFTWHGYVTDSSTTARECKSRNYKCVDGQTLRVPVTPDSSSRPAVNGGSGNAGSRSVSAPANDPRVTAAPGGNSGQSGNGGGSVPENRDPGGRGTGAPCEAFFSQRTCSIGGLISTGSGKEFYCFGNRCKSDMVLPMGSKKYHCAKSNEGQSDINRACGVR